MKKNILFPYHPDLMTLLEYRSEMIDHEISGFISYSEDFSLVMPLNECLSQRKQAHSQDTMIDSCDAVILLDNYREYNSAKYYKIIDEAILKNKEVIITPLTEKQLDLRDYQGAYRLLEKQPIAAEKPPYKYSSEARVAIGEIGVPVIGVFGMGKNCDKFRNQLLLKRMLEREYKTTTVSSNSLGALFGCYTIPSFLYSDISFMQKIAMFNSFILDICKNDDPDVIILGIPEGIVPFESYEFNHFAEYPLVISNAVSIDFAILCVYHMEGQLLSEGFENMENYCKAKFGVHIDAFSISQTNVEDARDDENVIIYEYLTETYVRDHRPKFNNLKFPIYNSFDRKGAEEMLEKCLRRLEYNADKI